MIKILIIITIITINKCKYQWMKVFIKIKYQKIWIKSLIY